jgi:hypothetical protein
MEPTTMFATETAAGIATEVVTGSTSLLALASEFPINAYILFGLIGMGVGIVGGLFYRRGK